MSDKLPISEIFTSPQGEGLYTGVLMTFVRFAGCTVGKPFPKERYQKLPHCEFKGDCDPDLGHTPNCAYALSVKFFLPIYTEMCTTYDGRKFECDTDYRVKERLTVEELMERIPADVKHVCISGGEPLMHNLQLFLMNLISSGRKPHIETSGTLLAKHPLYDSWVTVSPKFGVLEEMISRANEIKLLVDADWNERKVPQSIIEHSMVYIQPINFENAVNYKNLQLCLDLQKTHPNWRISSQAHKIWNVR